MLILTRRIGEMIMIGDDIYISIAKIDGNRVRIGVTAPRDILTRADTCMQIHHDSARFALSNNEASSDG